ncbi:EI24 domain-containing protein [Phreatobacter aquaticus]|nr:EI24 domain-containing protein [Phreatobacter aquaticus]
MLDIIKVTLRQIASPEFRHVLAKSVMLAVVLLVALWGLLYLAYRWWLLGWLASHAWVAPDGWAATVLNLAAGLGLVVLMIALTLPVLRFVAGNYLNEVAALVIPPTLASGLSRRQGPDGASNLGASAGLATRSLLTNLVMLPFALVPVVGPAAIFLVNSRNVGRSYFAMVNASRSDEERARLMAQFRWAIWAAGGAIVALSAVPVINVVVPTFGSTLMIHLSQRLMDEPS